MLQLLVLAGIAVFLILRLRSVLGTRDGFEKPPLPPSERRAVPSRRPDLEVIEGGPDRDIIDHVPEGSPAAEALARMKQIEPDFSVSQFIEGARAAYEMILMAFENGDISEIRDLLDPEVAKAFDEVIAQRREAGLTVEATFVGLSDTRIKDATLDDRTRLAEITVSYTAELTYVVRDAGGDIVEGSPNEIKRQRDVWTFARTLGSSDPNWQLVATGE